MNLGRLADFATMLPGTAMLRVYFLPSLASKTAVGFDVSTSFSVGWSEPRLRFYRFVSEAQLNWYGRDLHLGFHDKCRRDPSSMPVFEESYFQNTKNLSLVLPGVRATANLS